MPDAPLSISALQRELKAAFSAYHDQSQRELKAAFSAYHDQSQRELKAAFAAYHAEAQRDLNDRFAHWDEKHERRHRQILDEFTRLTALIDRSDEFDHLTSYLAQHLNVSVAELTGSVKMRNHK